MIGRHRIYGISVTSDFSFKTKLPNAGSQIDPEIAFRPKPSESLDEWKGLDPIYVSSQVTMEGKNALLLYRRAGYDVLSFTDVADFYVREKSIEFSLRNARYSYLMEIHFLGTVMCHWLESRGIPVLHSSNTIVNGKVVALLSHGMSGKTTLTAALMRCGYPLLNDGCLPLGRNEAYFFGHAGYPQLRMWPEQARHFTGTDSGFEKVLPSQEKLAIPVGEGGFGSFSPESTPLGRIYILERRNDDAGGIRIEPVPPRDAVIEMIRYSFTPRIMQAAGLAPQRMKLFTALAKEIPMKRICYPSGFEHLERVTEAILTDLSQNTF